jgi:hypothetical protein
MRGVAHLFLAVMGALALACGSSDGGTTDAAADANADVAVTADNPVEATDTAGEGLGSNTGGPWTLVTTGGKYAGTYVFDKLVCDQTGYTDYKINFVTSSSNIQSLTVKAKDLSNFVGSTTKADINATLADAAAPTAGDKACVVSTAPTPDKKGTLAITEYDHFKKISGSVEFEGTFECYNSGTVAETITLAKTTFDFVCSCINDNTKPAACK